MMMTEGVVASAGLLVREMLKVLERETARHDLFPSSHCYALARATAELLRVLKAENVEIAVGQAVGTSFGYPEPMVCSHAWLVIDGTRYDVKALVANALYGGMGPSYAEYEAFEGPERAKLLKGFGNACGIDEEAYAVIAERCLDFSAEKPTERAA